MTVHHLHVKGTVLFCKVMYIMKTQTFLNLCPQHNGRITLYFYIPRYLDTKTLKGTSAGNRESHLQKKKKKIKK